MAGKNGEVSTNRPVAAASARGARASAAGRSEGRRGRRATSREIAAAVGVSQATVSNVLNRPDLVAPETYEKVRAAMADLGFVVNRSARALRKGKSPVLGVVVLDLANPFWGEVSRGIEAAATELNQPVLLASSGESPEKEDRLLRLLEEHQVSAVLVAPVVERSKTLDELRLRGTHVVLLDRPDPTGTFSSVAVDHVLGAGLAAEHLIEMGHERVAIVNGPHRVPWCRDRSDGFHAAFRNAGAPPGAVEEVRIRAMTARDGEQAVPELLAVRPPVTAVFCVNDLVALGVLKGLTRRGIAVPDDVSLIGYDDDNFSELLSPSLTTVRQDGYELGQRAARTVLDGEADRGRSVVFPPLLVARESVARRLPPSAAAQRPAR